MGEELDTARRYRAHARELHTIAANKEMHQCRESLMRIATDYERMARTLEAIDLTNQTLSSRPPLEDSGGHFRSAPVRRHGPQNLRPRG